MKTTYRTTHSYKPHSRAERALTLAVLTALLSDAAAASAMAAAKNVTIAEDETVNASGTNHKACLTYDATAKETDENKTNSTSRNTLTILGTVASLSWPTIAATYSGGGQMSSLRTMYSSEAARLSKVMSTAANPGAAM